MFLGWLVCWNVCILCCFSFTDGRLSFYQFSRLRPLVTIFPLILNLSVIILNHYILVSLCLRVGWCFWSHMKSLSFGMSSLRNPMKSFSFRVIRNVILSEVIWSVILIESHEIFFSESYEIFFFLCHMKCYFTGSYKMFFFRSHMKWYSFVVIWSDFL